MLKGLLRSAPPLRANRVSATPPPVSMTVDPLSEWWAWRVRSRASPAALSACSTACSSSAPLPTWISYPPGPPQHRCCHHARLDVHHRLHLHLQGEIPFDKGPSRWNQCRNVKPVWTNQSTSQVATCMVAPSIVLGAHYTIRGDSMDRMGLHDGEVVAVRATPDAKSGEVVVAQFGDGGDAEVFRAARRAPRRAQARQPQHHARDDPHRYGEAHSAIDGVAVGAPIGQLGTSAQGGRGVEGTHAMRCATVHADTVCPRTRRKSATIATSNAFRCSALVPNRTGKIASTGTIPGVGGSAAI